MVENIIGLVEDADVIHDGNYCFITTPLDKSKWKVIPAAVNYPEYLWMGSLENETRRVGRGSRVREYVTEY